MSGDFTASLVEAVRDELKGFGLDVRGRGERRLSLRPAGLELWLKFSRPVDTGVSTVVWATFEVPVLSHLDEDVAPVACAALNRRFPFLCATAAEDVITFVGREYFYVGSPLESGVRHLVRRALLAYEAAQNVATLVAEGLWDEVGGARPAGASRVDLWAWALHESVLGPGSSDLEEAGRIVTQMLEGLGLKARGPRWGFDATDHAVLEYAGTLRGQAALEGQVLVRVDRSGGQEHAAGGVRVDIGGAPVLPARHTFHALNELNLHAVLKDQPPAGSGCWLIEADRLWYSQVLPPALVSRDALLDAVANGVELFRRSDELASLVTDGPAVTQCLSDAIHTAPAVTE